MDLASHSEIVVQQTLHGYRDGHRLLASSLQLPSEAKATLLALSDMSGPSMVGGFEQYVSGYPVESLQMYAFAGTWYAPEMPRPGCVWTHTLLIRFEDLHALRSAEIPFAHLTRPDLQQGFEGYSTSVVLEHSPPLYGRGLSDFAVPSFIGGAFQSVASAIFSTRSPVLLERASSDEDISLVRLLWDLQWGALRKKFKFCTGSLTPRRVGSDDFDFQILPPKQRSRFSRMSDAHFASNDNTISDFDVVNWDALVDTFDGMPNPKFKNYLQVLGPLTPPERPSVGSLAHLYQRLMAPISNLEVIELLRASRMMFPEPSEEFERQLLLHVIPGTLKAKAPFTSTLKAVCSLGEGNGKVIGELARMAWQSEKTEMIDLLVSEMPEPPAADPFAHNYLVSLIADVVEAKDVDLILDRAPQAFGPLAFFNARVLTFPQVWKSELARMMQGLLETVLPKGAPFFDETFSATLNAENLGAASYFLNTDPGVSVPQLLDWLESYPQANFEKIRSMMDGRGKFAIAWLKNKSEISAHTAAIILDSCRYDIRLIGDVSPSVWRSLAAAKSLWDDDLYLRSRIVLLRLALGIRDRVGSELSAATFGFVHEAVLRNRLPGGYWDVLRPVLPGFAWWEEWDRGEQLRQGLMDRFIENPWPPEAFEKIVREKGLWPYFINSTGLRSRHRKFLGEFAIKR
jgi:hypothetical protein